MAKEAINRKQADRELSEDIDQLEKVVEEATAVVAKKDKQFRQEIAERKRVESELSSVYDALNSSVNGVIVSNLEGEITYVNPSFLRMFEYEDRSGLIGKNAADLFATEEVKKFSDVTAIIDERIGETEEFSVRRRDGTLFTVEVSSSVVSDKDGIVNGRMASFVDITERKAAEEKTIQQQKIMNAINAVFQKALTCEGEEGLAQTCLEVAQELVGAKFGFFGEVNSEGKFDTLAISNPGWDECKMPESEATKIIKGMEIRGVQFLPLKDGKSYIFNDPSNHPYSVGTPEGHPDITCLLAVPLKYDGKVIGQIGLGNKEGGYDLQDQEAIEALSVAMTEALMCKQAEEELKKYRDHLEKMVEERERLNAELAEKNDELEQIVFVTSHDLRTPLVNVQGFSKELEHALKEAVSLLQQENIPQNVKDELSLIVKEDIDDALKYIRSGISKMDTLLAGLLKLSRLGRAALTMNKLDMNKLVAEVTDAQEFQIKEKEVKLDIGKLPPCRGDKTQINQVFSNLLDNALKYLDPERPGVIRISGKRKQAKSTYCVEDNGIGIAAVHQKKIFEIFHRLNPDAGSGEGLGLTAVRRILDRHKGRIWVESEPGKGSKFFVEIQAE